MRYFWGTVYIFYNTHTSSSMLISSLSSLWVVHSSCLVPCLYISSDIQTSYLQNSCAEIYTPTSTGCQNRKICLQIMKNWLFLSSSWCFQMWFCIQCVYICKCAFIHVFMCVCVYKFCICKVEDRGILTFNTNTPKPNTLHIRPYATYSSLVSVLQSPSAGLSPRRATIAYKNMVN